MTETAVVTFGGLFAAGPIPEWTDKDKNNGHVIIFHGSYRNGSDGGKKIVFTLARSVGSPSRSLPLATAPNSLETTHKNSA